MCDSMSCEAESSVWDETKSTAQLRQVISITVRSKIDANSEETASTMGPNMASSKLSRD